MSGEEKEKVILIDKILNACKASNTPNLDNIWFELVFLDITALKKIAAELYILV